VKNDERVNFQANERGQRETTEDIPRKKKKERKKERKEKRKKRRKRSASECAQH